MSFSCGCDESDWAIVDEYEAPWAGHKTIKCRECGCELAPGHIVHTTVLAEWWDEPFEDMSDELLAEVLSDEDTDYIHVCERCGDLSDAVVDTGMCYDLGALWNSYREWLDMQGLPMKAAPGRLRG